MFVYLLKEVFPKQDNNNSVMTNNRDAKKIVLLSEYIFILRRGEEWITTEL